MSIKKTSAHGVTTVLQTSNYKELPNPVFVFDYCHSVAIQLADIPSRQEGSVHQVCPQLQITHRHTHTTQIACGREGISAYSAFNVDMDDTHQPGCPRQPRTTPLARTCGRPAIAIARARTLATVTLYYIITCSAFGRARLSFFVASLYLLYISA